MSGIAENVPHGGLRDRLPGHKPSRHRTPLDVTLRYGFAEPTAEATRVPDATRET
jgi:hypothetical protein